MFTIALIDDKTKWNDADNSRAGWLKHPERENTREGWRTNVHHHEWEFCYLHVNIEIMGFDRAVLTWDIWLIVMGVKRPISEGNVGTYIRIHKYRNGRYIFQSTVIQRGSVFSNPVPVEDTTYVFPTVWTDKESLQLKKIYLKRGRQSSVKNKVYE